MRILLDEDVPVIVGDFLRLVLTGHQVDHVQDLQWKGKADRFVVRDAATRGYDMLVTNDRRQLADPEESRAIKRAGLHHVRYEQTAGRRGLALAVASIVAALPRLVEELEGKPQRLVRIHALRDERRYELRDPTIDPPAYWR